MVSKELVLIFLYIGLSHVASIPFLLAKLPPILAYVATGVVLRFLDLPAPWTIWEILVSFSLVFVGLHAGLLSKVRRDNVLRFISVSVVNVLLSATSVFIPLSILTGDWVKSMLLSLLLANTSTEGVLCLSRHAKYKTDAEIALEVSIGDDIIVLLVSVILMSLGGIADSYEILLAFPVVGLLVLLLRFVLKKQLDRAFLNAVAVAVLFLVIGLTVGNIGPLVGGYLVGIVLSSARFSGDPLLKVVSHVESLVEGLELVNSLVILPLVFTYIGLEADIASVNAVVVVAGLSAALLGKFLVTSLLKKLDLISPFSAGQVGALISLRGSLESTIALTALKMGLVGSEDFTALVAISLLTYPAATSILAITLKNRGTGRPTQL